MTAQKNLLLVRLVFVIALSFLAFMAGTSKALERPEWIAYCALAIVVTFSASFILRIINKRIMEEQDERLKRATLEALGTPMISLHSAFKDGDWVRLIGMSLDGSFKILKGHSQIRLLETGDNGHFFKIGNHYVVKDGNLVDLHNTSARKEERAVR